METPSGSERVLAAIAEICTLGVIGGFSSHWYISLIFLFLFLIVWLTNAKNSEFVNHHGKEAANYLINYGILIFIFACISSGFYTSFSWSVQGLFLLILLITGILSISYIFFALLATYRALTGKENHYIAYRFIK